MIRYLTDPEFMTDAELLAEYRASEQEADEPRLRTLAAEIEKRALSR